MTEACCRISHLDFVVTDFDSDTFYSSVLLTRRIKEVNITKWRFIVNCLPSSDLMGKSKEQINKAVKRADDRRSSIAILDPGVQSYPNSYYDPVVEIPDLEEMRIENMEMEHSLSPRRRGGNGFILLLNFCKIRVNPVEP